MESHDDGSYVFYYKTWGHQRFPNKEILKKEVADWTETQIEDLIKELDAMRRLKNFISKM